MYYLYSKIKEISEYIMNSLDEYKIELIKDASELFHVNAENSLILLHIDSYDEDSVELVKYLLGDSKNLKILALTNNVNFLQGTALLQAGVKAYGNVYMHGVLIKQAVDVVMSGNVWIYPELAQHLIKNLTKSDNLDYDNKLASLTAHEKECAILVAQGDSNKEIAQLLEIQEITVKKHLSSVYKKLSLKNRLELALFLK